MRQTNIFRTTKRDHVIPRDTMIRALKRSPGKDWCDPKTDAYQYLKEWALNEDVKKDGPLELSKEIAEEQAEITKTIKENLKENSLQRFEGHQVPLSVINEGMDLSPGCNISDKRTKAYKFLKAYVDKKKNSWRDSMDHSLLGWKT